MPPPATWPTRTEPGRAGRRRRVPLLPILFTNTSTHTCALRGYPGRQRRGRPPHQIGTSAIRTGEPVDTVSVSPGDTVTAVFRTNSRGGGTELPAGVGLRQGLPANSFQAVQIPSHLRLAGP
ncbi:DUF4232 domain-containing protein [Streptomyces cirratus]